MKLKHKPVKQQNRCVFCGQTGLSKQHLWPDWLKAIIPRSMSEHNQTSIILSMLPGRRALIRPDLTFHRGDIGARKLRNVCKSCNNGWMSSIEQKAKPILISLMRGEKFTLDTFSQKILASWISLPTSIGEFTDLPTLAIPVDDRRWVMANKEPPPRWTKFGLVITAVKIIDQ